MPSHWLRAALAATGMVAVVLGPVVASARVLTPRSDPQVAPARPDPLPDPVPNPSRDPAPPTEGFVADARALFSADAPDPFVARDHQLWLFTTNTAAGNVPLVTAAQPGSRDSLVVADALPRLPPWAEPGYTWAPAVTQTDGGWTLAFTARHAASGRQCIGAATAPQVGGPYVPAEDPLVCDLGRGGSIDPSFVTDDDGTLWLLYKDDGNCCGWPTTLHSVPVNSDATAVTGPAHDLLAADQPWEAGLIEAPSMQRIGDRWLLLYSANQWDTPDYAVGAAWCASPAGPCEKQTDPALVAGDGAAGPGGIEFVSGLDDERHIVTFHAWPDDAVGYDEGTARRLRVGRVDVEGDTVSIIRP